MAHIRPLGMERPSLALKQWQLSVIREFPCSDKGGQPANPSTALLGLAG